MEHLLNFLNSNNILDKNHYGEHHNHSTTTALADILYTTHVSYDRNKIIAILATDLTAAYDTVDKDILLQKTKSIMVSIMTP